MKKKLSYKKAGVDIEKANLLIKNTIKLIDTTKVKGSIDSIGGFGGFFDPGGYGIKDPLMVASTDGVGTKLKVAQIIGKHDTVGIDLVAMCVNDTICTGARPLFFLDYIAMGVLDNRIWTDVIKGIIKGCRESGCALLGGETAEMPGMYRNGEYDLAGFSVGIVDREKAVTGKGISPGDVILGIESSGLHSNGYSLARKVFNDREILKEGKLLLKPTIIYVKPVLFLLEKVKIKGIAHITGGGFYDNIPRVFPKGVKGIVKKNSWKMPRIFELIREKADIDEKELFRTFNMGIGMVLVLSGKEAEKAGTILKKFNLKSYIIGEIVKGKKEIEII